MRVLCGFSGARPSATVVAAKVELKNPISGYDQVQQTDATGNFRFTNIPFNNYHV